MRTGMYQHPVTTVLIVTGHQPFHPFHFGPRPFHFGNPLDPGQRVPNPLVGSLPFKLTGKLFASASNLAPGVYFDIFVNPLKMYLQHVRMLQS
jgi:hypothetical protein